MASEEVSKHYFRQARSCLFRWADDGGVFVWDSDYTIAFRAELAAVMKRLSADGLPPLNAIGVLLSACRDNWPEARGILSVLAGESRDEQLERLFDIHEVSSAAPIGSVLRQLDRINSWSAEVRADLNAKCELAAMIFEVSPHRSRGKRPDSEQGRQLAAQLSRGLPQWLESQGGLQRVLADMVFDGSGSTSGLEAGVQAVPNAVTYIRRDCLALLDDLREMQNGLSQVTEEALQRRLRTGVEDPVRPADEQLRDRARSLIGELQQDEELGGMVHLARDLQALLTFPRQLSQPEQLPVGGLSDITNRGQPDRLLLSELAHDDLTLSSRIALNEALYLQRESPPAARIQHRRVLLDTGLCLWGIPRIFAASVGLSIAAGLPQEMSLSLFRVEDGRLQPVDFTSRDGVLEHVGALSPELHPGDCLNEFLSCETQAETDFVIVTHSDVAADGEFRKALADAQPENRVFLVTLDGAGSLTISSVSANGSRILRTGKLDIAKVLDSPKKSRSLTEHGAELPVFLQQRVCPLRFYHQAQSDRGFATSRGFLMCTGDGRLLLWDKPGLGALQLSDRLGTGKAFWYGTDMDGVSMLVFGRRAESSLKLILVHDDGDVSITPLHYSGSPCQVSGYAGRIFLEFHDEWRMYRDGQSSHVAVRAKKGLTLFPPAVANPGMSAAARFVHRRPNSAEASAWFALADAGSGIELQRVPVDQPNDVAVLFDRRGRGIVAVSRNGQVRRLYGDEGVLRGVAGTDWAVSAIAADGSTFILTDQRRRHSRLISTDSFAAEMVYGPPFPILNCERIPKDRAVRKRFAAISAGTDSLILRSTKGSLLEISRLHHSIVLRKTEQQHSNECRFEEVSSPQGCEYRLHMATWNCGSRAWLDSRGLLHLHSCSASVPQITLVLCEGRMSGWCESRGTFGLASCSADGNETPLAHDSQVFSEAVEGFVRCLSTQ